MRYFSCIFLTSLLLTSIHAQARVYKCEDASGAMTYSQTPCITGSSQKTLVSPAKSGTSADVCIQVGTVAQGLYSEMKRGKDASALIEKHGSVSGINPRLLNIINYVSGFRYNTTVSGKRVGQLANTKCKNGGFGNVSMDDLPISPEERMRMEVLEARRQAMQPPAIQHGKTISVSFNNTPVEQAIGEISSKAGVPITIHGAIPGAVSMQLDNVPWQQPLTAIVLQHNLQMGGGAEGVWIAPH